MAEEGWGHSGGPAEAAGIRLDAAITQRGLARSRTIAAQLIAAGLVSIDGKPVVKASVRVTDEQDVTVAGADHYVSRAAHKLIAALDTFPVAIEGALALDVGASTGGFTQVLLERGARRVIALDVGHDQLAPPVRADERVSIIEGYNARSMTRGSLATATGIDASELDISLVVADLSFISIPLVLPAVVETVGTTAQYVLLVKPQFEVGRTGIREGIVRQPHLRTDAVTGVLWAGWDLGLGTAGVISSPIAGAGGNHEYLVWLSADSGSSPSEWTDTVTALTEAT